jgi:hypothetical protein
MSNEPVQSLPDWIKQNAREYVAFCAKNPHADRRGLLRLWLETYRHDWEITLRFMGRSAVLIFYEELNNAQTKH